MFDGLPTSPFLPLSQSAEHARAMALLGAEVEQLSLSNAAGVAGHAMIQTRRLPVLGRVGLISRGPIWCAPPDARLLARRLAALRHPVLLNADGLSRDALADAGFLQVMTGAAIARLDLGGDTAARRARMHQKWRNRLVRAEAGPLRIRKEAMPADPDHWLLRAETTQRGARRYRALPIAYTLAFVRANPGKAQLFTARLCGETVAGLLVLRHGPTATYHIGHTDDAGRLHNAHTLLLAHTAEWLTEEGVRTLELGALDTVNTPGLARFKLGSGAIPHTLGGTWLYARRLAPLARCLG